MHWVPTSGTFLNRTNSLLKRIPSSFKFLFNVKQEFKNNDKPCSHCSKKNLVRFHPDEACWFKENRVNLLTREFEFVDTENSKN
ncbi:hypothetical protein BLOT_002482 [Blomia tropicalis]|nr:hypothetical protein BLOT_002482 [Blomia tropicalis]